MLVWLLAQDIVPSIPTDPTGLLDYGPLGLMALFLIIIALLILKLAPQALEAWTEMNTCAAKQAVVLERTTAAVEEHRSQSAREHVAAMEAMGETTHVLKQLHACTKDLSEEIKRRNSH